MALPSISELNKYSFVPNDTELKSYSGPDDDGTSLPKGMVLPPQNNVKVVKYGATQNDLDDDGNYVKDYPNQTWGTNRVTNFGWDDNLGYSECLSAPITIRNTEFDEIVTFKGHYFNYGTPLIWISRTPGGAPVNDYSYAKNIIDTATKMEIYARNKRADNGDFSAWRRGIRWKGTDDPHGIKVSWRHRNLEDAEDDGTPNNKSLPLIVGKSYYVNYWWHRDNLGNSGVEYTKGLGPVWKEGTPPPNVIPGVPFWTSKKTLNPKITVITDEMPTKEKEIISFEVKTNLPNQIVVPFKLTPGSTRGVIRWYVPKVYTTYEDGQQDSFKLSQLTTNRNNAFIDETVSVTTGLFAREAKYSADYFLGISDVLGEVSTNNRWNSPFDEFYYDTTTDRPYMKMEYIISNDPNAPNFYKTSPVFSGNKEKLYLIFNWPGKEFYRYGSPGDLYFEIEREELYTSL